MQQPHHVVAATPTTSRPEKEKAGSALAETVPVCCASTVPLSVRTTATEIIRPRSEPRSSRRPQRRDWAPRMSSRRPWS